MNFRNFAHFTFSVATAHAVCMGFFMASTLASGAQDSASAQNSKSPSRELVVLAYDSLVAKGGLLPAIIPEFEKRCACKVRTLSAGDGAQVLSRLILDEKRGKPTAHVAMGIDQNLWADAERFAEREAPQSLRAELTLSLKSIAVQYQLGAGFIPLDQASFAWMVDRKQLADLKIAEPVSGETSWEELLKPPFAKQLLLQDPRTSTPGLALVRWAYESYGPMRSQTSKKASGSDPDEGARDFFKKLRPQWLTLTPGWDQAYGMFLKGQAPLVWSYVTSEAYHRLNDDATDGAKSNSLQSKPRYYAWIPKEGTPAQIEGSIVVRASIEAMPEFSREVTRELAWSWAIYLMSDAVQSKIPTLNWMLPVREGIPLPPAFALLPKAGISSASVKARLHSPARRTSRELIKSWESAIR